MAYDGDGSLEHRVGYNRTSPLQELISSLHQSDHAEAQDNPYTNKSRGIQVRRAAQTAGPPVVPAGNVITTAQVHPQGASSAMYSDLHNSESNVTTRASAVNKLDYRHVLNQLLHGSAEVHPVSQQQNHGATKDAQHNSSKRYIPASKVPEPISARKRRASFPQPAERQQASQHPQITATAQARPAAEVLTSCKNKAHPTPPQEQIQLLLGLNSVNPAAPGVSGLTSKPKAHHINQRLQVESLRSPAPETWAPMRLAVTNATPPLPLNRIKNSSCRRVWDSPQCQASADDVGFASEASPRHPTAATWQQQQQQQQTPLRPFSQQPSQTTQPEGPAAAMNSRTPKAMLSYLLAGSSSSTKKTPPSTTARQSSSCNPLELLAEQNTRQRNLLAALPKACPLDLTFVWLGKRMSAVDIGAVQTQQQQQLSSSNHGGEDYAYKCEGIVGVCTHSTHSSRRGSKADIAVIKEESVTNTCGSMGALHARLQGLLGQLKSHQEKLNAMADAGSLSRMILENKEYLRPMLPRPEATDDLRPKLPRPEATDDLRPKLPRPEATDGAGQQYLEKVAGYCGSNVISAGDVRAASVHVGPALHSGCRSYEDTEQADGSGEELRVNTPVTTEGRRDEAACMEMVVQGPVKTSGHLWVAPVKLRHIYQRLCPQHGSPEPPDVHDDTACHAPVVVDDAAAWKPACAILQSKSLAQHLGLMEGSHFMVQRPWRWLHTSADSSVVLVFCATPSTNLL
ncbi:hypothetical protein CEUSTIGMA_g3273.t1 [Chlamydomonas eustigma]|uniref:Uncharacterized protein n=1 Tax=Chlamydomonas eustigma TaxID=1157962 RepID=A0A250WZ94_9CHLO|nr:hypothetical protein CEUSTIGMA_g3273.t1 [Chlamydomonas eustigma]|eukprot:GAX75830.1 hypothetical protein CEUSTIGMA_g3273.t1 [Chlamydomonas eustigma]